MEIFLIFEAWKCVLPCREIHVARIPSFELSNFPLRVKNYPHFSSLKMQFLPIRGTNVLRYLAKRGNFLHFSCLKMHFCAVVKYTFQRHKASCLQIFRMYQTSAIWQTENAISADSWNQRFKVPRKDGGNFLNFWISKMRFCRVVRSTIKGYQASCEQIFRKY